MTRNDFGAEELEKVEELRVRMKGTMEPEMYADTSLFIRYLRARNHDLKASENMLRNHINWRKQNKVDTIFSWYTKHEVSQKYVPISTMTFDKEGSPVTYVDFGNLDTRGLLKSLKPSEIVNFCIEYLELQTQILESQSEKLKKPIEKWVLVFNFDNFSLAAATHKPSIELFLKVISMYESNHPERLKLAIAINASWYFHVVFAAVKPFISGPTLKKIKIIGREGWKEELFNHIEVDNIPVFLGGTLTDPDGNPMCKTLVKHGAKVPESCYAANKKINFAAQPNVKKVVINRLSKMQVELNVLYPNSYIEWEFETKEKDISFSLLYKESKNCHEAKEILPKQRVDASMASEEGVFKCDRPGVYFLEFDNSYSWLHQKEIYYKVEVSAPHNLSIAAQEQ